MGSDWSARRGRRTSTSCGRPGHGNAERLDGMLEIVTHRRQHFFVVWTGLCDDVQDALEPATCTVEARRARDLMARFPVLQIHDPRRTHRPLAYCRSATKSASPFARTRSMPMKGSGAPPPVVSDRAFSGPVPEATVISTSNPTSTCSDTRPSRSRDVRMKTCWDEMVKVTRRCVHGCR